MGRSQNFAWTQKRRKRAKIFFNALDIEGFTSSLVVDIQLSSNLKANIDILELL